jgi:hypothetical protein
VSNQPQLDFERELTSDIAQFYADPYGYVMYAFPWGSGELEGQTGPDRWQAEQLQRIGQAIRDDPHGFRIQEALASGHGVGKSAETAWIILWAMSTRPHLAGWATANTMQQLKSKTWRELSVWHKRAINAHWFVWTATRFYQAANQETWGIDAIPWSEHNSEAFAGLHAEHVLMIMDEASSIADVIWEVSEGAMTTPRAMWFAFGNPTRTTGRFRECFGKHKHRWSTAQIDSRTCKMTDKRRLQEWLDDHGEDSDFYRVRVRGEFPRQASNQLISSESVHYARKNNMPMNEYMLHPIVIGVDVARFGADETVITARQGRKQLLQKTYRGLDNMQVGARAAELYRELQNVKALFVDEVGTGSGVVDYLRMMGYPVIGVNAGAKATKDKLYVNKRAEIWCRLRDWLDAGADIIDDPDLAEQITATEYDYTPKEQIRLEKKDDLKARGLPSPDRAEALALTFAEIVQFGQQQQSFEPEFEQ